MPETNPDILLLLDRLANPGALDDAIGTLEKRLRLLRAIREALHRGDGQKPNRQVQASVPSENGTADHLDDGEIEDSSPNVRNGRGSRRRRTPEQDDSARRQAAQLIAIQGPQTLLALRAAVHCGAMTIYDILEHPWFEQAGGKWELSSLGRQEAVPVKED